MKRVSSGILPILLVVTIVVITGFQLFWIWQNFQNEKRSLEVKTGINFREAVYALQAAQLSNRFGLPVGTTDSFQIEIVEGGMQHEKLIRHSKTREVVSMVNVLRNRKDSLIQQPAKVTITANPRPGIFIKDSTTDPDAWEQKSGAVFIKMLSGIDSLTDTLKLTDIHKATNAIFIKEKIDVPFSVIKKDTVVNENMFPGQTEVTVGFAKPSTYKLELGNTAPYLFMKLLSPILFSIFLIAVTMASFVLLYRNLLQQQRLAALKNDFISNVTHELKTPIATVNVALEAMKNFNAINDPVKTKEYLDISQGELQRLSLLVDKVLRISMFENREIHLNNETVDMSALVSEVASSMRLQFEKKSANIHIEVSGDNTEIQADRLHMMSVVYNLFDNALKYSEDAATVNVDIKDLGDQLELSVADNGIGIPVAYRRRVFEKFFRVPHGDTHNVKGYGLGLSYVSQIIREHHGTIRVESAEGQGSRFIITIPRRHERS